MKWYVVQCNFSRNYASKEDGEWFRRPEDAVKKGGAFKTQEAADKRKTAIEKGPRQFAGLGSACTVVDVEVP